MKWLVKLFSPAPAPCIPMSDGSRAASFLWVPPMADYTRGCERHFYEDCPNCGQGAAPLKFPEIDPSLLPAKEQA